MMDRKHFKCTFWKILWGLGALCVLFAWYTNFTQATIANMGALAWFWNALVLGVLAIPIKLDCHNCGVCGAGACEPGMK
ncbi:MAG: hypothetical protein Q8R30_02740 [bacterium]|nr:hypothetical protein [bacterium]